MRLIKLLLILLFAVGAACNTSCSLNADEVFVAEGWNLYQGADVFFVIGNEAHQFESVPLGTFDFGGTIGLRNTGLADTIVQRLEPVIEPFFDPVDTRVLAMSFRSVEPINLGSGLEFVTTSVGSSSGIIGILDQDFFDFSWDVDLVFTGETSGMTVTQPIWIAGLDWAWGRTPLENDSLRITGVNRFLNGLGTTDQDFWPREPLQILDGGFGFLTNARIPEPSSTAVLGACLIVGLTRRRLAVALS